MQVCTTQLHTKAVHTPPNYTVAVHVSVDAPHNYTKAVHTAHNSTVAAHNCITVYFLTQ